MNIHLSELIVILIVALLVIKPERLPEASMLLGKCIKAIKQKVQQIKNDFASYE